MAPNVSLLKVSANASLLECERAAQEFVVATHTVFFKAQGLVMLAPLYKMVFGLLEGLLDNWHLLNLDSIEWQCKAEVRQACVNLWSLNKQAPWCAEFGKMVLHSELSLQKQEEVCATSSALPPTQEPSQQLAPCNKGKGKANATEDDEDKEGEATQRLRKELEDFMVPTKFDNKLLASLLPPPLEYYEGDIGLPQGAKILGGRKGDITLVSPATRVLVLEKNGTCDHCIADNLADQCWYLTGECPCWCCCHKSKGCLWNGIGVRMQKKHPSLAALILAKHVKLVQAAKAFLEWQGKLSPLLVLEGYKGKGKAKALLGDSEQMGTR
ncbi:hypothetical protein C0995_002963 [Termitomyces sp. Mi166|nr:hypothetical protein C0995_002963 [Termitomyces sp. Mi166\